MVDSNVKEHEYVVQLNNQEGGDSNGVVDISAVSLPSSSSSSTQSNNNKNNKPSSQEDMVATIGNITVQWKILRGGSSNESSLVSLTGSNDSGDRYSVSDSEVDHLEVRLNSFQWNDYEEVMETESLLSDKNKAGDTTCILSFEHGRVDMGGVGTAQSHDSNYSSIEDTELCDIDRYDFHEDGDEHNDKEGSVEEEHRQDSSTNKDKQVPTNEQPRMQIDPKDNDDINTTTTDQNEEETIVALISNKSENLTNLPADRYSIEVHHADKHRTVAEDESQDSNNNSILSNKDESERHSDTTCYNENPVHDNQSETGNESQTITNNHNTTEQSIQALSQAGEETNDDSKDSEIKMGNKDLIEPSNKSTTTGKVNEHDKIKTGETINNESNNPMDDTNAPDMIDTDAEDDDGSETSDDTLANKSRQVITNDDHKLGLFFLCDILPSSIDESKHEDETSIEITYTFNVENIRSLDEMDEVTSSKSKSDNEPDKHPSDNATPDPIESDIKKAKAGRRVSFDRKLVSVVFKRDRITPEEKALMFYTSKDIATFRMEYIVELQELHDQYRQRRPYYGSTLLRTIAAQFSEILKCRSFIDMLCGDKKNTK